jgi:hypothetical protein
MSSHRQQQEYLPARLYSQVFRQICRCRSSVLFNGVAVIDFDT